MVDSNTHIINRINVTITCGQTEADKVHEIGLASCLTDSLENLLPLLNKMFGTEVVRLEELTISLDIDTNQLSNLSDLLKKSLGQALSELVEKEGNTSKTNHPEHVKLEPNQVFLYFLKNGTMPWFSANMEYREAYFSDPGFRAQCRAILKTSPRARERLVQQFKKDEVFSVLGTLYPTKFISSLFDITHFVSENTNRYSKRYAAGFRLKQFLLSQALTYLQKTNHSFNLRDFLSQSRIKIAAKIKQECNGKHSYFIKSIQEELAEKHHIKINLDTITDSVLVAKEIPYLLEEKIGKEQKKQVTQDLWTDSEKENQLMVINAGIVLLHPFVKRFFKKVGLLENNQFISMAHQQRAICLLHNLATGELTFPEEKLLFYKFLCHYPLDRPIPRELPISDFELEEIQQVLNSVISHWKVLKRTSISGLRINFLQRKGLLEKDALGYTLHVESQTSDILLDQLPWGLSAAHWPWLPHLLTIKWR